MADIVRVINEDLIITETTAKAFNFETYGIQGSNPLTQYTDTTNVMLRDAVKANWNTITTDPPASDIFFSTVWTGDFGDIDLVFLLSSSADPNLRGYRSTDWSLQTVVDTIDIHIWVRGAGGEEEPKTMRKLQNALKRLIKTKATQLIPYAHLNYLRTVIAPIQRPQDLQSDFHKIMSVECVYMERTV